MIQSLFNIDAGLGQKTLTEHLVLPFDPLHVDCGNIASREEHDLLTDERRRIQDMRRRSLDCCDNRIRVIEIFAVLLHQDMGNITENLLPDAIVETGHDSQHHDQRSDTKRDPGNGDKRDYRNKRLLTLSSKVSQADKEFVVHKDQVVRDAGRGTRKKILDPKSSARVPRSSLLVTYFASGRSCGKRITSRIDWELVSSITKRSMPIPSPAVGGRPYSRARI